MSIAEVLAEKLSGKRTASGFVCCCPAHEDTDPSLSIMEADDGGLIVHCFANCAALDVYAALRRMNALSDTSTPVERPAPDRIRSRTRDRAGRDQRAEGGPRRPPDRAHRRGQQDSRAYAWMGRAARAKRRWGDPLGQRLRNTPQSVSEAKW